jgi:hypothetical protein
MGLSLVGDLIDSVIGIGAVAASLPSSLRSCDRSIRLG